MLLLRSAVLRSLRQNLSSRIENSVVFDQTF